MESIKQKLHLDAFTGTHECQFCYTSSLIVASSIIASP